MGVFREWQPRYAQRGIATFPVGEAKRPLVRGWPKVGLKGSAELAAKFNDTDALGYVTGRRSHVTVLDIDTTDYKVVADAIRYHGQPTIITRTASGKYHLLYRYNGESRRIRPFPNLPIDVLGDNGYALAAPSKIASGQYEIIHGHIDDIDRLTPMVGIDQETKPEKSISIGQRNNTLFDACIGYANTATDFDEVLAFARKANAGYLPPMDDNEVVKTAKSAWRYKDQPRQHGCYFPTEEVVSMLHNQDAFFLLAFLRAHNGPWATFMCANGLGKRLGWGEDRVGRARRQLIERGYIKLVRQAGRGTPALFRWLKKGSRK